MKKRLLSMLMAVLMIASLVPATALAAGPHANCDVLSVNIAVDAAKKQPGIEFEYCNSDSTKGHDVILKALEVTPFAEASDICLRHSTKTVELQAATCDKPSIKLTYCPVCGTAAADALQISWKNVGHSYTKFVVKQAPTCNEPGWGYTVCDKCGEPELVVGYYDEEDNDFRGAAYYLYYGKEMSDVTTAARDAVMKQFNPTNLGHENKVAFVTPTKDVYVDTWKVDALHGGQVGYVDSVLTYRAAVEPTHANTINGEAVVNEDGSVTVMPYTNASQTKYAEFDKNGNDIDGAGYSGDKYCPDCGHKVTGTDLKGLNEVHKMDLKQAGYAPYIDNKGIKHDGKTDVWTCRDCGNKDFGGKTIAYSAYYPNEGTRLPQDVTKYVEGDLFVLDKIAATCEVKGSTGDTYKLVDGHWNKIEAAKETPALGHQLKKIESKAPTCTEIGWTCSNYYICTREGCNHHQGTAVSIPAIIHSNVYFSAANVKLVDIVAPTCKNTGLTAYVCTACNEVLEIAERVPAVPHTAGDPVNAKEATCTEVGYTGDKVCKWCGIMLEKGKEIPMKEHTVVDVAAVEATCTADGMTAGTKCSVCGTVLSGCEVVKALGHDYKDGKCTRCGEKDPNYVAPEFKDAASIRDYAKDAVAWAAKEGIVKGDDNGNFLPTADITRQDFVTMLWRLKGSVASEKALTFGDKADIKDYAQTAVAWAVENGYIKGRDNGNFDPAAKITRAEIVAILNRIAENAKAEKAADFTDIATHWAKDAIAWAAEAGIVNGVGNNMFAPNDNASRQDTVVMLYKFVNLK